MSPASSPRHLLATLAVAIGLIAGTAAPASADVLLSVPVSIQGGGLVVAQGVQSGGSCAAPDYSRNADLTTTCAPATVYQPGVNVASIFFTAVPASKPAGHYTFVRWEGANGCSGSTATQCVISGAGSGFTIRAVFTDSKGPTLTSGQSFSTSEDRTVHFTYSGDEPVAAAECSIDGGAWATCDPATSKVTYAEGPTHTFEVRGRDGSGNTGPVRKVGPFAVVDTTLVGSPPAATRDTAATFRFSTVVGDRFECALDLAPYAPCGTPGVDGSATKSYADLLEGIHTFRVRAVVGADRDTTPVVRTWTIDRIPPTVSLLNVTGPGEGALQAVDREVFTFSSDETGGTFECRLDTAGFAPCASGIALEGLAPGPHRFEVRAVDAAGNRSPAAARTWSVAAPDRDGDGFNALVDCDDADKSIRPGAVEIAGNSVDENCDGIVEPAPSSAGPTLSQPVPPSVKVPSVKLSATPGKRTTRLTKLSVEELPAGSTVAVACKGAGCPKALKGKGAVKRNVGGSVSLIGLVRGKALGKDAVLTITTTSGATATVTRVTVRAGRQPLISRR
ncbi:MAG: putative metal-binding motif-containing protein [Patulibacter minatonensis]